MRSGYFAVIAILSAAFFGYFTFPSSPQEKIIPAADKNPLHACDAACALLTEPDAGIDPVMRMISAAQQSIDLVIYELQDASIEGELIAAAKRGLHVRVILSLGYNGKPSTVNVAAYSALSAGGVPVHWSPAYFSFTHEKSFVFDNSAALIMSFNLVPRYYSTGRDFGVLDRGAEDVAAMESAFDADWNGMLRAAPAGDNLVWSPGSRPVLLALIGSAQKSLLIYNEEMADVQIEKALAAATQRGVDIRIIMTYSSDWKKDFTALTREGVGVRTFPGKGPLYIHAKMILADDSRAFVGSENFSGTSLDENRELGIIIENADILHSLEDTFANDWERARPYSAPAPD